MRGAGLAWLVLAGAQDVKEEKGTYRLSCFGREAGEESYRLTEFETGVVVLMSQVKFEVEIRGEKRGYVVDTSLTMSKGWAPQKYAGYHKAGREEKLVKLDWEKGKVLPAGGKPTASKATHLLDNNTIAQLLPILRTAGAPRKVKVFRPALLQDQDLSIEDRGELLLAGPDASLRVRELRITAGYLDVVVHIDDRRRILRAWQVQAEVLAELDGYVGWKPLPPPPAGLDEQELLFKSGEIDLAGTVTRPKAPGKAHAVLLLSASGPQDRHGNVVPGKDGLERFAWEGPDVDLFRELAAALAGAGMIVLRYDDRGCGRSGGVFATSRLADFEADAEAAVRALRARGDVDRLLLVGHDEGGLLALKLAERTGAAGAILLAAPAATLDVVLLETAERTLREQGTNEELIGRILEKERATYGRIKASEDDWLEVDERRTFVGWMRDRFRADPLKAGGAPWAAFHGERDRVVAAAHGERWGAGKARLLPGLDHVFRRAGGRVDPAFLKSMVQESAACLQAGR